jgi:hypothetical protein
MTPIVLYLYALHTLPSKLLSLLLAVCAAA